MDLPATKRVVSERQHIVGVGPFVGDRPDAFEIFFFTQNNVCHKRFEFVGYFGKNKNHSAQNLYGLGTKLEP
jgi:hypothetical protein